ncbi:MAG: single-stranded DNA-binding protein [Methylococcaceae bacterium]
MSNVFSCTGSLGRDAELKQVGGGSVLNFAVANSIGFGDKKTTLWLYCALWGKRAESVAQYLVKGQSVFVSGELSTREYQAKDGTLKTTLALNVSVVDLLGKKSGGQQYAPAPVASYQTPHQQHAQSVQQFNQEQHAQSVQQFNQAPPAAPAYDDDIPF